MTKKKKKTAFIIGGIASIALIGGYIYNNILLKETAGGQGIDFFGKYNNLKKKS